MPGFFSLAPFPLQAAAAVDAAVSKALAHHPTGLLTLCK